MLIKMEKVYGPYVCKDGRSRIQIIENGKSRFMSWPKYLMEKHLGCKLLPDETVDHINGDFTDNRIENFRVLGRSEHVKRHVKRSELVEITCLYCGNKSLKVARHLRHNQRQGKSGPFCSKRCVGLNTFAKSSPCFLS